MDSKNKRFDIGEAIYISNGLILVSNREDWGWSYSDDKGHSFVFSIDSKTGKEKIESGSEKIEQFKIIHLLPGKEQPRKITFEVKYKEENEKTEPITVTQKDRISLETYIRLQEDTGYYPFWLVPMLGSRSSGKTCWLYALRTWQVMHNLQKLVPNVVSLHLTESADEMNALPANQLGGIQFVPLKILDENRNIRAMVCFVDLAGEIATVSDKMAENMRVSIELYAAGLIVIRNSQDLLNKEGQMGDPTELLSEIENLPKRICCVVTGADQVQKNKTLQKECLFTKNCPVFDEAVDTRSNVEDKVYEHMAVAADLLNRKWVNKPVSRIAASFFVNSCEEKLGRDGKKLLDFSHPKNVELPAAYMLKWLVK